MTCLVLARVRIRIFNAALNGFSERKQLGRTN